MPRIDIQKPSFLTAVAEKTGLTTKQVLFSSRTTQITHIHIILTSSLFTIGSRDFQGGESGKSKRIKSCICRFLKTNAEVRHDRIQTQNG